MRAVVLHGHGDLDSLTLDENFPDPQLVDGHVVIAVGATSFNYHDVFTVRGMPGIKVPFPMIIGLDIAGEIIEVASDVTDWKVGDRVLVNPLNKSKGLMGEMMHGGVAEKCLVAADQLITPDDHDPQHHQERRQSAGSGCQWGRRHRLCVAGQEAWRRSHRLCVERRED